MIDWRKYLK